MSKMISIDALKPLIEGIIPEGDTAVIEGIMGATVDYDEDAVNERISAAVEAARAEESANYSEKLRNMFFGEKKESEFTDSAVVEPEPVVLPEIASIDELLTTEE